MRQSLLLIFLCSLAFSWAFGQDQPCVPDANAPADQPIFPIPHATDGIATDTSGINLPACIGEPYQFTLTIRTPAEFQGPNGPVPLKDITMNTSGAIRVIPPGEDQVDENTPPLENGMGYSCFPPNCVFPKDSLGCISLEGTPDFSGPDTLNLGIIVTLNFSPAGALRFAFPDGTGTFPGNFFLEIKNAGECAATSTRDLSQEVAFGVLPNPAFDYAELQVESSLSGRFQLRVMDMLGRSVQQRAIELFEGDNRLPLNLQGLSKGIYLINISQGGRSVTRKLVVGQ